MWSHRNSPSQPCASARTARSTSRSGSTSSSNGARYKPRRAERSACAPSPFMALSPGSAEGEDVRAHARFEEGDLEGPPADGPALADELVHPRLGDGALPGLVDVDAVSITRSLAVEAHGEGDRVARGGRREDEIEVARLEAVRDRAGGRFEHGGLLLYGPAAGERPLVERQPVGSPVGAGLAAGVAHVGLRGPQRAPVGRLGEAAGFDTSGLPVHAQQSLDRSLGLLVGALAEVVEPDTPVAIDEVDGRPVVVLERAPDGEVVVDDDRVAD